MLYIYNTPGTMLSASIRARSSVQNLLGLQHNYIMIIIRIIISGAENSTMHFSKTPDWQTGRTWMPCYPAPETPSWVYKPDLRDVHTLLPFIITTGKCWCRAERSRGRVPGWLSEHTPFPHRRIFNDIDLFPHRSLSPWGSMVNLELKSGCQMT